MDLTALLVDDEPLAREGLRMLLEKIRKSRRSTRQRTGKKPWR